MPICSMKTGELKEYLAADLYRHKGRKGTAAMLKTLRKNRSFKITFWLRLAQWARVSAPFGVKQLLRWQYRRVCRRYCVDLPETTQIGKGLIIYHCYGLVVNGKSIIGDNVMLAHQITLADERGQAPVIGDRVRIAPGAKVIGGVTIGDGVVVGANCVVVKDVPPNSVTVGIPNRVIAAPYDDDADRYYWPPAVHATKGALSTE
jgi:serine O-acetyltransferase